MSLGSRLTINAFNSYSFDDGNPSTCHQNKTDLKQVNPFSITTYYCIQFNGIGSDELWTGRVTLTGNNRTNIDSYYSSYLILAVTITGIF